MSLIYSEEDREFCRQTGIECEKPEPCPCIAEMEKFRRWRNAVYITVGCTGFAVGLIVVLMSR